MVLIIHKGEHVLIKTLGLISPSKLVAIGMIYNNDAYTWVCYQDGYLSNTQRCPSGTELWCKTSCMMKISILRIQPCDPLNIVINLRKQVPVFYMHTLTHDVVQSPNIYNHS